MAATRGIKLTEQHLRLIYDTFVLMDDDKDGLIDKSQFFTLFRALGQTVSDAELSRIFAAAIAEEAKNAARAKEAAPKKAAAAAAAAAAAPKKAAAAAPPGESVSFQQFVKTFSESYQRPSNSGVLTAAFGAFDAGNSGKLATNQLMEILTKRGEPLCKSEVEEFFLLAAVGQARETDYALLAKRLVKGPAGIATIDEP